MKTYISSPTESKPKPSLKGRTVKYRQHSKGQICCICGHLRGGYYEFYSNRFAFMYAVHKRRMHGRFRATANGKVSEISLIPF